MARAAEDAADESSEAALQAAEAALNGDHSASEARALMHRGLAAAAQLLRTHGLLGLTLLPRRRRLVPRRAVDNAGRPHRQQDVPLWAHAGWRGELAMQMPRLSRDARAMAAVITMCRCAAAALCSIDALDASSWPFRPPFLSPCLAYCPSACNHHVLHPRTPASPPRPRSCDGRLPVLVEGPMASGKSALARAALRRAPIGAHYHMACAARSAALRSTGFALYLFAPSTPFLRAMQPACVVRTAAPQHRGFPPSTVACAAAPPRLLRPPSSIQPPSRLSSAAPRLRGAQALPPIRAAAEAAVAQHFLQANSSHATPAPHNDLLAAVGGSDGATGGTPDASKDAQPKLGGRDGPSGLDGPEGAGVQRWQSEVQSEEWPPAARSVAGCDPFCDSGARLRSALCAGVPPVVSWPPRSTAAVPADEHGC